jgi:PAS domain S-box-containing protein
MESEAALRKTRDDLEDRVRERTRSLEKANRMLEEEIRVRQKAEQGLRQAGAYTRGLIEATVDPMSTINPVGKIGDVNKAFELMTGLRREELIGTDFADYFTDDEAARAVIRQVFREEQVRDCELEMRNRDGGTTPVLFNASVYRDEKEHIGGIIAVARDITIRKRNEALVRQNAARLEALARVSEALSRAGLNPQALLDGLVESAGRWIGDACLITQVSEDRRTLIPKAGYHADPAIRAAVEAAFADNDRVPGTSLVGELLKTKKPLLLENPTREELKRKLSPRFWGLLENPGIHSVALVPLDLPNQPFGILSLFRTAPGRPYSKDDLMLLQNIGDRATLGLTNATLFSELGDALAKEKSAREELIRSEKFAAMGRMLGSVAHELNNPLQTITNCLFLTEGDVPPESPVHEYLAMANAETKRLESLVSQLRELYRAQRSQSMVRLDLAEVLAETRTLMDPQLAKRNVVWEAPEDMGCVAVNGLRDRLKQVFINLATNAADAMQPAGGKLIVGLVRSADGREAGAVFTDTGPGIPEQNLGRLFEPFFTTKSSGLGLGLPICYEIAHEHGGRITVASPPGQGATFTLWLPLVAAEGR